MFYRDEQANKNDLSNKNANELKQIRRRSTSAILTTPIKDMNILNLTNILMDSSGTSEVKEEANDAEVKVENAQIKAEVNKESDSKATKSANSGGTESKPTSQRLENYQILIEYCNILSYFSQVNSI